MGGEAEQGKSRSGQVRKVAIAALIACGLLSAAAGIVLSGWQAADESPSPVSLARLDGDAEDPQDEASLDADGAEGEGAEIGGESSDGQDRAARHAKQDEQADDSDVAPLPGSADACTAAEQPDQPADHANGGTSAPSDGNGGEWVEETERVWVVDKAAWTEVIPLYETEERSICNICGADITGSTSAHNKQHMLAGEGSGYHSETVRVQTGTQVIDHPEEGHWEVVSTGGHWE